ncbi:RbsD/FucU domain-containing protein [Paenibacillus aestuarii]|uniref:RbsD/FucU domain-containing protein n=1 Tax=Paenibacillus aestuarii TaxID=516965 RepID=A0ABW0K5N5_9BACL|nr:RbsD/FucU domain-containing protein [Paenibacillus aestuarii]
MQVDPGDPVEVNIWEAYIRTAVTHAEQDVSLVELERAAFYERCRNAYAVVATGESALYANLIIRKGVVAAG